MIILITLVTLIATIAALYGFSIVKNQAALVAGSSMKTKRTATIKRTATSTDDIASAYLKSIAR